MNKADLTEALAARANIPKVRAANVAKADADREKMHQMWDDYGLGEGYEE